MTTPLDIADSLRELCDEIKVEQDARLAELRKLANMIEALSPAQLQLDTEHWLQYPLDHRPVKILSDTIEGIDLAAQLGCSVFPCADGVVVFAGPDSVYGNCVRLAHIHPLTNERWWTRYSHLHTVSVLMGSRIHLGDMLGVTDKHMLLSVQRESGFVNPRDFVRWPE